MSEIEPEAQMVEDTAHDIAPVIPRYSRFPSLLNFMVRSLPREIHRTEMA